jgi:hypothetical protein
MSESKCWLRLVRVHVLANAAHVVRPSQTLARAWMLTSTNMHVLMRIHTCTCTHTHAQRSRLTLGLRRAHVPALAGPVSPCAGWLPVGRLAPRRVANRVWASLGPGPAPGLCRVCTGPVLSEALR